MQVVEFKAKHLLADSAVNAGGRPVLHPNGRPVTGGELVPGRVYSLRFDEKKPGAAAVLMPAVDRADNRAKNKAQRKARRAQRRNRK